MKQKITSVCFLLMLAGLLLIFVKYNKSTVINVKSFGAAGDGYKDDTASIQKALDTGSTVVIIPDGVYLIDALQSLKPTSNQTIQLAKKAVLKVKPNSSDSYSILSLTNVSNVVIEGGTLLGDRYEHTGLTGQWGHGIQISTNTKEILIKDMVLKNFWGDGIYIGSPGNPTDIASEIDIKNIELHSNRRQGISITHARNVTIDNVQVSNTHGTSPECGIDLEPNGGCYVEYVTIKNSTFTSNAGYGISMFGGYGLYINHIDINQCTFRDNKIPLHLGDNSSFISINNCKFE